MSSHPITGHTRFVAMLGDPVVQVKSPAAFAAWAGQSGTDAVMIPIRVDATRLGSTLDAMRGWGNCAGAVVTYPHKQAVTGMVDTVSEAARLVDACNVVRRSDDGKLHGDMTDGPGFVAALRANGIARPGPDARLIGAGGAGSAIALALLDAGVSRLVISDHDRARQDALVGRLSLARPDAQVLPQAPADFACALVCNATPVGMNGDDRHPFPLDGLPADCVVADVIPSPAETPWLIAARARGHVIQTGPEMVAGQMPAIVSILFPDTWTKS